MTPRTKIARALWRALTRAGVSTPPQDPDTEGGRAVIVVEARERWDGPIDPLLYQQTPVDLPAHWDGDIRRKYEGRWSGKGYNAAPSPPRLTARGRVRK